MADLTFAQFVEGLHQAQIKNFWGEVRVRKTKGGLPKISDLLEITPDLVKDLAQHTAFSVADLDAGYRVLCVEAAVTPAWPSRIYP